MATTDLTAPFDGDRPLALHSYHPLEREETLATIAAALAVPAPTCTEGGAGCTNAHRPLTTGTVPVPDGAPRLLGLAGAPRAGKDVIAAALAGHYQGVRRVAFSDPIIAEVNAFLAPHGRSICERTKSHGPYRRLLQQWGLMRRRETENYWTARLGELIGTLHADGVRCVIATGVRAPSDVELIETLGGVVWRVVRPGAQADTSHPIERALSAMPDGRFGAVIANRTEGDTEAFCADARRAFAGGTGLTERRAAA